MSEEEQKDKLLEMMFEKDERQIYDERYEKSTFDLDKEIQKLKMNQKLLQMNMVHNYQMRKCKIEGI